MADLSKHDKDELVKNLSDKREALRVFRFGSAGTRTRNVREGRNLRKEIAQIMTELKKREIASSGKTK